MMGSRTDNDDAMEMKRRIREAVVVSVVVIASVMMCILILCIPYYHHKAISIGHNLDIMMHP